MAQSKENLRKINKYINFTGKELRLPDSKGNVILIQKDEILDGIYWGKFQQQLRRIEK